MRFLDLTFAFLLSSNLLFTHALGLSETLGTTPLSRLLPRTLVLLAAFLTAGTLYAAVYLYLLVPYQLVFLSTLTLVLTLGLVLWGYGALRGRTAAGQWPEPREILYHTLLVGGVLVATGASQDLVDFVVIAAAGVAGYAGALVLLDSVLARLARERIPALFQGLPLQLFTAGLVWLILSGLNLHLSGNGP